MTCVTDGGYHVPVAHKQLSQGLDLDNYRSDVYSKGSIQSCQANGENKRLEGSIPSYAYIFPNLMLNRYGPWLDINIVLPVTETSCIVKFEYFVHRSLLDTDLASALEQSHTVQLEDVTLCENVQRGLSSGFYTTGRYAPNLEAPMFEFHKHYYNAMFSASSLISSSSSGLLKAYLNQPAIRYLNIVNSAKVSNHPPQVKSIDFDGSFVWDIIHERKLVTTRSVFYEPHIKEFKQNDIVLATSNKIIDSPFCMLRITGVRTLHFYEIASEDMLAKRENVSNGIELQQLLLRFYPNLHNRSRNEDQMIILDYEVILPNSAHWEKRLSELH